MLKSTIENKHKSYIKKYEDDKNDIKTLENNIIELSIKIEKCQIMVMHDNKEIPKELSNNIAKRWEQENYEKI